MGHYFIGIDLGTTHSAVYYSEVSSEQTTSKIKQLNLQGV